MKTPLALLALALCFWPGATQAATKIVFIAGHPSHGPGEHEHLAGCLLLEKCLADVPNLDVVVYHYDWPKDPAIFKDAAAIIIYSDGGAGHPAIQDDHLQQLAKLMEQGVGLGCIHYAVEVPKEKGGPEFLDWIGGYFETFWSVNPHWTADFKSLPSHPITRGVKPFQIRDEWYYHMRFPEDMKGVTPILSAVPPDSTRGQPGANTPHSGNPHVQARAGQAETVMWARQRPGNGRGFGITGAHFHANWGNDNFRKLVLNAILWIAHVEVPKEGVSSNPSPEELKANLDPKGKRSEAPKTSPSVPSASAAFKSGLIKSGLTDVNVDLENAKGLWLIVQDGGDGFGCDWADWAEPRLLQADGSETKLTDLKWRSASSGWGQVRVNQNAGGGPLLVGGKKIPYGIGTHANSVIEYDLGGRNYTRFQARVGLDKGGVDQGCGSTVEFLVFTKKPPTQFVQSRSNPGRENAVRGAGPEAASQYLDTMTVPEGLEVSLFASEPMLLNPADMDVDAQGRVWVTEGANYRRWSNPALRPEGDRIVILEDKDHDGTAEEGKIFYQDPTVNAALGICVLGNEVIVSSGPHVLILTDTDGDDKADKRRVLFTGISGNQHDHGIHAFVFGPDGKLYFNFGNAGEQLRRPAGNGEVPLHGLITDLPSAPVIDLDGKEVSARSKPYRQGMVFRCNRDGSEVETLAWNFRNNYEVCVDSFGSLWQSDNDDDGNRGVRINFVMEYGNYGYQDELTGAGWSTAWDKAKEKGASEEERPFYHWHQYDPGVVPNLLQTGNGSPTGILVYEGDLLPEPFRNQIIHADAGPRVVRAYPVQKDGAGYKATMVDLLTSSDTWYRPSDVCAGPDGSIYVADWNDPGVGGHNMGDNKLENMRGRVYRVAPSSHKPALPKLDLKTPAGAARALRSPNQATRYLAWQALEKMGPQAEPELEKMWSDANPRFRARAFQLLMRLPGHARSYVLKAIKDSNPDIRIVGLRTARTLKMDTIAYVEYLSQDPSPQVRRECAIALRHNTHPDAPALWTRLALQHDGKDRWYLEALGIGAEDQEEAFFKAWIAEIKGGWNTPAGRDIIWRIHSQKTPAYLVKLITDKSIENRERYLRALDYVQGPEKDAALVELISGAQ